MTRGGVAERLVLAGLFVAFTVCLAWAGSWDAHWHWWIGRDSLWIPPHILMYVGIGASAVLAVVMALRRAPAMTGSRVPQAHRVVAVGAAAMLSAALIDILWHRTIGDRTVWSPPHVLFVLGGLIVGLGMATAFVRAARDGVVPDGLASVATRVFVGVLLTAGSFSFLPIAMLVFHPNLVVTSRLLFAPSPLMLAGFASLLMPAILLVSREVLGPSQLQRLATIGFAFWGGQQVLHLALTPPAAAIFGYVVNPVSFPRWPFELAFFAGAVAPVLVTSRFIATMPLGGGVLAGLLYAGQVHVVLSLLQLPAGIDVWGFAVCALLGAASGGAGLACGRWIGSVIYAGAAATSATQPSPTSQPWVAEDGMLVTLLGFLCNVSPFMRRWLWRMLYEALAARDDDVDWAFMNYGFADLDPQAHRLPLAPADEKDRSAIQLYHHVAASVDLGGRDVLEVGCGRGGGASYISRYLRPRTMVGVDFSREAIVHCRRHRTMPGLSFAHGDAEALPFGDDEFDVVLNIESSHCYGSVQRFLAEVYRVLRPGGLLLLADLRFNDGTARLREHLRSSRFLLLDEHVITRSVVKALECEHERRQMLVSQKIPAFLRQPFMRFAGTKGTRTFQMLNAGQADYLCCTLVKAAT